MAAESGFLGFIRAVIRKVQIGHILLQIAGIVYIENVGVLLAVALGIHLRQLAFANARDAVEEHLVLIDEQFVELFQFPIPAQEPAAGLGNAGVEDVVHHRRGQIARSQQLAIADIPLLKPKPHGKAQHLHDEQRLILKRKTLCQLVLHLGRYIGSLHQKVMQLLHRHGRVGHHGQYRLFDGFLQLPLTSVFLIVSADFRTQLRQTIDPAAYLTIVQLHILKGIVDQIPEQGTQQIHLIGTHILIDVPPQDGHHRGKIQSLHFFTSFFSIYGQFPLNAFSRKPSYYKY